MNRQNNKIDIAILIKLRYSFLKSILRLFCEYIILVKGWKNITNESNEEGTKSKTIQTKFLELLRDV